MDRDAKAPWEGAEVKHVDGAVGKVLGPVPHMPGFFKVKFKDGIKTNQKADALLINGEPLDRLMLNLDREFSGAGPWKELCHAPIEFFKRRIEAWRRNKLISIQTDILSNIAAGKYKDATTKFASLPKDFWPKEDFLARINEHREKIRKERNLQEGMAQALSSGRLWEADEFFYKLNHIVQWPVDSYLSLKRRAASASLAELAVQLDDEQTEALLRPEHRLLIRARAGSGKTRTLAAKATLAIKDEKLDPDRVLILAFNKSAATEIKRRVRSTGKLLTYENARTFHSLAHQLVKPKKKLLFDAGGHPSSKKQSLFIQAVIQKILTPAFKEALYSHFRKELELIEEIGRDLPEADYFLFRRSLEYVSLSGDKVKSNGEKVIADFLFEHGIRFEYEKVYDWKKKGVDGFPYAPDFSILSGGHAFVLEHWAIDPNDPHANVPEEWDTDTKTYRYQITNKRAFWEAEGVPLLETHSAMLDQGREMFEARLHAILTAAGITCNKVPQEELIKRVVENDFVISHLAAMFLQFIQRSKKRGWAPDDVARNLHRQPDSEERSRIFHDLALHAYREYQKALDEQGAMDFDDLLVQATDEVKALGTSCTLHLGLGREISLGELRWVLVDEFQDFSELYYRMLDAILAANPQIKLVAVGDDWQAINAFAGAETRFFRDFSKYFGGETVGVTTNYRSERGIVSSGNTVMLGRGVPAKSHSTEPGIIQFRNLKDVWIEFRTGDEFAEARKVDSVFLGPQEEGKSPAQVAQRKAKALKACAEFALESPEQDVLLLARTNNLYRETLTEFSLDLDRILAKLCKEKGTKKRGRIKAMTAHGSKGQESATVILLNATKKQFPKIHPDNLLFIPFGVTPETVLEEERRLFYVAVTRSEKRLLILTEKDEESPFLKALSSLSPNASISQPTMSQGQPDDPISKGISHLVDTYGGYLPTPPQVVNQPAKPDWATIRADADTTLEELLTLLESENLPYPSVAYELPDEDVEASLAWPNAPTPVAILVGEQQLNADLWRARGYKIPPESLSPSEVIRGIKHYVS